MYDVQGKIIFAFRYKRCFELSQKSSVASATSSSDCDALPRRHVDKSILALCFIGGKKMFLNLLNSFLSFLPFSDICATSPFLRLSNANQSAIA